MAQMVRKQIYIQERQQSLLKRVSRLRGVSEAELIRDAIDRQVGETASRPAGPDPASWEKAHRFMVELQAKGSLRNRGRTWTREELYEERLNRHGSRSD